MRVFLPVIAKRKGKQLVTLSWKCLNISSVNFCLGLLNSSKCSWDSLVKGMETNKRISQNALIHSFEMENDDKVPQATSPTISINYRWILLINCCTVELFAECLPESYDKTRRTVESLWPQLFQVAEHSGFSQPTSFGRSFNESHNFWSQKLPRYSIQISNWGKRWPDKTQLLGTAAFPTLAGFSGRFYLTQVITSLQWL